MIDMWAEQIRWQAEMMDTGAEQIGWQGVMIGCEKELINCVKQMIAGGCLNLD